MAEKFDPKDLVRIQEVLMANSIMIEALTQLLLDLVSNEILWPPLLSEKI
jgi:hypothetical protein